MLADLIARAVVALFTTALLAIVIGSVIQFPWLLAIYIGLPLVAGVVVWAIRRVLP